MQLSPSYPKMSYFDLHLKSRVSKINLPILISLSSFFTRESRSNGLREDQTFLLTLSVSSALLGKRFCTPGIYNSHTSFWSVGLDYSGTIMNLQFLLGSGKTWTQQYIMEAVQKAAKKTPVKIAAFGSDTSLPALLKGLESSNGLGIFFPGIICKS